MAISIIHIVRNSLKFSLVRAISAILGLPVTIYVATILVPEEYGIYGFLGLWLMYAGLIGPGIFSAGQREIPVLLGRDEEAEALTVQNISISSEMLYTVVPFVIILGASSFFSEPILKFGLIIVAISYLASRLVGFWSGINFIREHFNIVAKARLIALISPLVIAASVYWLKVYALLIAPVIASVFSVIYYCKKGPINYHFALDRTKVVRLLKVGVILQGLTLIFWAFRLTDRTIIAATLPLEQLGLYTYAMAFLMYALTLPTDFGRVLQPILWREAGKASSIFEGFAGTARIAVYMALGLSVLIPIAQLVYYLVMNLITIRYAGSIPIFYVLSYNLYLASIVIIPNLVLRSSIVNRQNITLCLYAIGLALNIAFDLLVIKLGYGVVGVAWVTVCVQALVTLILYRFIKGYISKDMKEFLRFQARILFPFLIVVPFYFFHNYLNLTTSSIWTFVGISLAAQVVLWSLVISIFYRDYISISDIKAVIKEVNTVIGDRLRFKKVVK